MILLNPGPVVLTEEVRQALTSPDICHREAEFSDLQDSIRQRLLDVYNLNTDDWSAVLLAGSGTAAMEAMIASLVPDKGHVLVIENGVYGERLSRMAQVHGIKTTPLHHEWDAPVDLARLEETLTSKKGITHVTVIHHETTTGRLNDLAEIDAACKKHNVGLLVDAVSSFGAEEIIFDNTAIAAVAGTANKCLHGAPGVSFVITNKETLANSKQRTVYLDLATYATEQDKRKTPFTQPGHLFYAFDKALEQHQEQGGCQARHDRYQTLARKIRSGLIGLGIKPLLTEKESSVVLNAYFLPEKTRYQALHDDLKEAGFIIYAGQGQYSHNIFRISTMGEISDGDIERLLAEIDSIIS